MRTLWGRASLLAVFWMGLILSGFALLSYAHSTGHESRTVAQCQKLPGTAKTGERAACIACVTRKDGKWHFHPDYPAGDRCRPDNGKP